MPSVVIPTMRYRDAGRMIDWLCGAFGFERRMVIDDGSGGIAHAELTFGDGMIMLGSARDDDFGKLQSTPSALGGRRRARTSSLPTPTPPTRGPRLLGPR